MVVACLLSLFVAAVCRCLLRLSNVVVCRVLPFVPARCRSELFASYCHVLFAVVRRCS